MILRDVRVPIACFDPLGMNVVVYRGNYSSSDSDMSVDSFGLGKYFFKPEECSTSDSSELRAGCFPFDFFM